MRNCEVGAFSVYTKDSATRSERTSATESATSDSETAAAFDPPLPDYVDWVAAVGLSLGLAGVEQADLGIVVVAAMLVVLLFVAAYGAGLGALGGFAGGRFAENQD